MPGNIKVDRPRLSRSLIFLWGGISFLPWRNSPSGRAGFSSRPRQLSAHRPLFGRRARRIRMTRGRCHAFAPQLTSNGAGTRRNSLPWCFGVPVPCGLAKGPRRRVPQSHFLPALQNANGGAARETTAETIFCGAIAVRLRRRGFFADHVPAETGDRGIPRLATGMGLAKGPRRRVPQSHFLPALQNANAVVLEARSRRALAALSARCRASLLRCLSYHFWRENNLCGCVRVCGVCLGALRGFNSATQLGNQRSVFAQPKGRGSVRWGRRHVFPLRGASRLAV